MYKLSSFWIAVIFFVLAALPFSAYAAFGTSFGGRVVSVLPCLSPLGPSLQVNIAPAGGFSTSYIWTPATVTFMAGPPNHPGQQNLGVADIPFACVIPSPFFFIPALTLFGQRMQFIGTSVI
jgi:hypothetical protein